MMLMNISTKIFRHLSFLIKVSWCSLRGGLFITDKLFCFPTCIFWMIIFRPLNLVTPSLYRKIEGTLFHLLNNIIPIWTMSAGYTIIESGDQINDIFHEETLIMANHQSTADVPFMMTAFSGKPTEFVSQLNWIMDKIFMYTHFGLVSFLHGDFFVNAGHDSRQGTLEDLSKYLRHTFIKNKRKWLVLFPEGGFLRKRREGSQRYAEKNGLPKLQHVTLPRMGALASIIQNLSLPRNYVNNLKTKEPGYLKFVVDLTIAYPKGVALSAIDAITGYATSGQIHFHYRKYPVQDVPVEEDQLQLWIHQRYVEKEEMLNQYYETGVWRSFVRNSNGQHGHFVDIEQRPVKLSIWLTFFAHVFFYTSTYCHYLLYSAGTQFVTKFFS